MSWRERNSALASNIQEVIVAVTMKKPAIGVLTLGQTPRPDLVEAVQSIVPGAELTIRGGFDGLSMNEIESYRAGQNPEYALMVRLANGETMDVDMYDLLPNLTKQAELLAGDGAQQIVLMCSGGFAEFTSPVPVIRPVALFQAYVGVLAVRKRVGILNPIQAQVAAASTYWQKLGYTTFSDHASPFDPDTVRVKAKALGEKDIDCLMLDCMSFTHESLRIVQETVSVPVLLPMKLIQVFFQAIY